MDKLFFMRIVVMMLLLAVGSGCDISKREKANEARTAELNNWEQRLTIRENSLKVREEQIAAKERLFDSTKADSIQVNAALPGAWQVKMTCTETTCATSAVGDVKNETWMFAYENNKIVVRAMANDKLLRVYTGSYINNAIELVEEVNSPSPADTKIVVRINMKDDTTMDGHREIVRPDCRIMYSLQLNKA